MTEQQQELYEKLLKKVNEYCLGYAAEDVIAAIDALVESYDVKSGLEYLQDRYTLKKHSKPLQALENIIETFIDKDSEDIKTVRTALKALEIIYTKEVDINWLTLQFEGADIKDVIEYVENYPSMCSDKPLTADEITLLKEIYDDILQVQKR